MNSSAQTGAIFVSIVLAYLWLNMPSLEYYSAQLAAVMVLVYFLVRLFRRKHPVPLSVSNSGPEFALVSAATLLLIGSTGNTHSLFFPLAYLHIFFLTMTLRQKQAILLGLLTLFFHFALMKSLNAQEVSQLLSMFMLLSIFLFAKDQYEQHMSKEMVVERQQAEISDQQSNAILFITTFLKPKLETLLRLSDYPDANKEVIQRQIIIVQDSVEEVLQSVTKDKS